MSEHRDRSRRRDSRDDYESNNRRERNKDRYHEKNDRHDRSPPRERQRPRDRSRSRRRDDRKNSRFDNEDRKNSRFDNEDRKNSRFDNKRDRRDRNHDRFTNDEDGNLRVKRESSPDWGRPRPKDGDKPKVEKEKPNFELSGKLTEDTNTVNGIVIKYSEPDDAKKPKRRWRLYPFKGEKALPFLPVHRQSAYLLGRDRKIADIPLDHPSCSKQHAALQYRLVPYEREPGKFGKRVRPYLIDLESANGTTVNNVKLEPKRFHELLERDVIKFGFSSREYVLLHEASKDDDDDDDVDVPNDT